MAGAVDACTVAPELDPRRLRLRLGVILTLTAWLILRGGAGGVGRAAERLVPLDGGAVPAAVALRAVLPCAGAARRTAGYRDRRVLAPHRRVGHRRLRHGADHTVGASARRILKRGGARHSAIAHGSAAARSPGEQGLWGIFEVFADTIVICTAPALTILCSGVGIPWGSSPGAELLLSAWETCIPAAPAACFMALSLLLFAFTSVLGWALYGTQCVRFLWGEKAAAPYRLCFSLAITVGCLVSLRTVWAAADLLNGLMAIPNFIALFALSGKAAKYAEM
ncbi:MAG: alanine:cation symporter family protein [Oscillospiraceae bacterium]